MKQRRNTWTIVFLRVVQATLCSAVLVGAATGANFLTTAPKAVSLLFEPFSLLLLPGLFASLIVAGPHDYDPALVIEVSFVVYFFAFYLGLTWLSRRRVR